MFGFYFYAINTTQQNSLKQKPRQKNLYKIYVQSFLQNRKHNYNNCQTNKYNAPISITFICISDTFLSSKQQFKTPKLLLLA